MDSFSFPSDLLLPMVIEKGKNKCEAIFPIDDESIYNLTMMNFTFGDSTDSIRKIPQGCPDEGIQFIFSFRKSLVIRIFYAPFFLEYDVNLHECERIMKLVEF